MKKNQVYILCRPEGKDISQNIKEALERRRYSVFIDIDSGYEVPNGIENKELEECIDFIPILTNDAWLRQSKNDSYIQKLEIALDSKNVVPIITRGVVFPSASELPDSIKDLANRNGLPDNAVPQCFDGIMDRLDTVFLNSHRKIDIRAKYFFYTASVVAIVFIIVSTIISINSLRRFPVFKKEKEAVSLAVVYFAASMQGGNNTFSDKDFYKDLEVIYDTANDYMKSDSSDFISLKLRIDDFKKTYTYTSPQREAEFSLLDNTRLTKGMIFGRFSDYVDLMNIYNEKISARFELILNSSMYKDLPSTKQKWLHDYVNLKKEIVAFKNCKYHLINLLLCNVDYNAKDKDGSLVLQEFLNHCFIPNSDVYWETSVKQVEMKYLQDKENLRNIWNELDRI